MGKVKREFDKLERKQKALKFIPLFLMVFVLFSGVFFAVNKELPQGKKVVGEIIDTTVRFSETGNKPRLKVKTDKGLFWVALPAGNKLMHHGEVALYEVELGKGKAKYTFLHYQQP